MQGQQQQQPLMQQFHGDSILKGFDAESLSAAFKVNQEMGRRVRGENVKQGHIITVQKELQVERPQKQSQPEDRQDNGIEETSCSENLRINIDKMDIADIFNPQAGQITSLNSHHLPILSQVKLSAERGLLRKVITNSSQLLII